MKKVLATIFLLLATNLYAQANWQTIHTEHFNIHYTQESHDWARSAANELEIVRTKVLAQQNRALDEIVDVIVFDPLNSANGFAIPPSTNPMMALFTTPPQSDTVVSNTAGWQQLLILHEYVHLVHLAQPTRSDWRQAIREVWDLYDLTYESMPRWAAEGYATLLESKMTGRGRLFDNYSEAILTEFAQQGSLPSYDQLSDVEGGYMAGSMAYLLGARFLRWLEERHSEDTLDAVWTRMQGVKKRDFDEAFSGVFGDSAKTLYRRFIAEYTYKAMAKEQTEIKLESKAWLDLAFHASNPALSPNKQQVAVVERDKDGKTQLIIYSTEQNTQAAEEFAQAQQEILNDDPLDIVDSAPAVFKRKQQKVLNQINRAGIQNPQWLNDEEIYFGAYTNNDDVNNTRVADIFSWHINTGEVKQLTDLAGLRRFSIADNGQTLYAERSRSGYSELVKYDVQTATATPLFDKSLEDVFDYPVLSPNKAKLAYLRTTYNHNWQLYIQDLKVGKTLSVPMPKGYQYLSQPSWGRNGQSLYFVAGLSGALDIYRFDIAKNTLIQMTQGQEAFAHPQVMNDGAILYLSITHEGLNFKQLAPTHKGEVITELATNTLAPQFIVEKHQLPAAKVYTAEVGKSLDYDPWQQNATAALGAQYNSASTSLVNVSLKGSDLLKQFDWQIGYSASINNEALSGAFAEVKYGLNHLEYNAKLFMFDMDATKQSRATNSPEHTKHGGYVDVKYLFSLGQLKITPSIAYNYTDIDTKGDSESNQQWLRAAVSQRWSHDRQSFSIGQSVLAQWYEGDNDNHNWQGYDFAAKLFGKAYDIPLYVNYQQRYRDNTRLTLGGFSSTLIANNAHAEYVFAKELPFNAATAERYQGYGGGMSFAQGMPWFYYQQHQVDSEVFAQSYGIKWQDSIGFGLASAGINDLHVDFGLAKVEGDSFEDELRGWLGFYYSL